MSPRQKNRPTDIRETLRQIREEYWSGIEESRQDLPADLKSVLVFRLAGERYGISAPLVREVLRIPRIVRVPMLPMSILGIINLRGEIVAVSDLRPFLGLPSGEFSEKGRLVVTRTGAVVTALAVEEVEGLRSVASADIEPLTQGLAGLPREAVEGQVHAGEELLVLLRLDYILGQPQFIIDADNG